MQICAMKTQVLSQGLCKKKPTTKNFMVATSVLLFIVENTSQVNLQNTLLL